MKYWSETDNCWIEGENLFDGKRLPWQSDADPAWKLGSLDVYEQGSKVKGAQHESDWITQADARKIVTSPATMGLGAMMQKRDRRRDRHRPRRQCACGRRTRSQAGVTLCQVCKASGRSMVRRVRAA